MTEELRSVAENPEQGSGPLRVESPINNDVAKVWEAYTNPKHIMQWNHADSSWHCPRAENDLRPGGRFSFRMEAKDGSEGFDFSGVYEEVIPHKKIVLVMDDGRRAVILFEELGNSTHVSVSFDPENQNPHEMQISGWQAILDNFKKHAESL
jgi:uncharacterized protein YndB with AHSA1/START domain